MDEGRGVRVCSDHPELRRPLEGLWKKGAEVAILLRKIQWLRAGQWLYRCYWTLGIAKRWK